jgi:hypothetical protein
MSVAQNFLFFLLLDEGSVSLAHLLPVDFVGNCFFVSASVAGCCLVEADSASRNSKTENFRSTDKGDYD